MAWIIPTQSAINAFAMLAVCIMFLSRARDAGLDQGCSLNVAAIGTLGGFAGAKVLGVALATGGGKGVGGTLSYFGSPVVSWGAFGGCLVSVVVYLKLRGATVMPYVGTGVSCLGLGISIARIGCFLAGDDFGIPSDVPWAMSFPRGTDVHS